MLRTPAHLSWTMNPYSCFSFLLFFFLSSAFLIPFRASRVQYPLFSLVTWAEEMRRADFDERGRWFGWAERRHEERGLWKSRSTLHALSAQSNLALCQVTLAGHLVGWSATKECSTTTHHKNWKRSTGSINLHTELPMVSAAHRPFSTPFSRNSSFSYCHSIS